MAFKELLGLYILRRLLGHERAERFDATARRYAPRIASIVFGIIGILHTFRFALGWEVVIAGQLIPVWISVVVIVAAAYLSYSLWPTKRA